MTARGERPAARLIVDAGALAEVLLSTASGKTLLPMLRAAAAGIHAPALLDAEVVSVLRRRELRSEIQPTEAAEAMAVLVGGLPITRHPLAPLIARSWQLRRNFTIYDALYVALAEALEGPLLTLDHRLAAATQRHSEAQIART